MKRNFDINVFSALPKGLKKADYVDLLLLLNGFKPCVRLGCTDQDVIQEMQVWCKKNQYKYCFTKENYFYISQHMIIPYITMKVDNSLFNHTYILGRLLGYPKCCCKKMKEVGECNIDVWEKEFCSYSVFLGDYKLINPSGYTVGEAFISHIPCSSTCEKSLDIAKTVYSIARENKNLECFESWKSWFE